jgi:hypothetical protein
MLLLSSFVRKGRLGLVPEFGWVNAATVGITSLLGSPESFVASTTIVEMHKTAITAA